ncbi:hypothetical protein [Streptomyces rhizosphaericus]|nr:hypothetical protein [Streptomyces rhizosphaericus]
MGHHPNPLHAIRINWCTNGLGAEMGGDERDEPHTLQEKIVYLLDHAFPDGAPSDREFCRIVESHGGALSHSYFGKLRKGQITEVRDETLQALALGFGIANWRFFKDQTDVVEDVMAGLALLAGTRTGDISGIAGRSIGEEGMSAEMLDFVLEQVR